MSINVKVNSSISEAEDAYVNVNGQWKIAKSAWANLNGTWQQTHALEVLDKAYRFNPGLGFSNAVSTVAIQSDGKIIVGGFFLTVNGLTRTRMMRLNADGTEDTAFYNNLGLSFNNQVISIMVQSDDKILVAGSFTQLSGSIRNYLVRLNSDGTEDTAFYANLGTGFNSTIQRLLIQSDGKILVGGDFSALNGATRNRLVRLNSNGTEDTAFYANLGTGFNSGVRTLAIHTTVSSFILVGGLFTTLNGNTRNRLVRLNLDGTEDTGFYSNLGTGFNSDIQVISVASDAKILVGGGFFTLNGLTRNRLVRLNSNGTEDTAFYSNLGTGINNTVRSLAIQSDGKILVGGDFITLNGATRNSIVRLNSTGTEDTAFYANLGTGFNGAVNGIAIQSDGRIIVTSGATLLNGITRNYLVRLNPDATLSSLAITDYEGLSGSLAPSVQSIGVQSDGKIVVGGNFTTLTGLIRNRLVQFNTDGTEDTAFYINLGTGFNGVINSLAIQSDGKILVGGSFTTLNGATRNRLVRLNSNGTEDTAFYTNLGTAFNNTINAIAIQSDGKILVGGEITTLNGLTRNRLVRLNSNGTEDTAFYSNLGTSFSPAVSGISCLAVQADGKILVGGQFTDFNSLARNRLLRLNSDGTEDTAFYTNLGTGFNSTVNAIVVQSNGNILVGGTFVTLNGANRRYLARLSSNGIDSTPSYLHENFGFSAVINSVSLYPTGEIVVAGGFTALNGITRNRLVKLNSNGTEDSVFSSTLGTVINNTVSSTAIQSDGKILIGGNFSVGTSRSLARIDAGGQVDTSFVPSFQSNRSVFGLAIQSNGQIIAGGDFTTLNSNTRNYLVRLNSNGTEDAAFYSNLGTGFNNTVNAIAIQSDGKIIVGGGFTTLNGATRNRLVRLNSDGTLDIAFYTNLGTAFGGGVNAIAIQSDGKILVGGDFTTLNGITRSRMVRLNSDGTVDTTFYSNLGDSFTNTVSSITIQSDGKIIVGGNFVVFNRATRNRLVRLNSNGTEDTAFYASLGGGFSGQITTSIIQADGKIIVGGNFTTLNSATKNYLARLGSDGAPGLLTVTDYKGLSNTVNSLAIQPNGSILVGGQFISLNGLRTNRLGRFDSNLVADDEFYKSLGAGFSGPVSSIAPQSDGKILVGGNFSYFTTRYFAPFFARIKAI